MPAQTWSLTFTGLQALVKKIEKIDSRVSTSTREAVSVMANKILSRAKALTPVDEGDLKASGHIEWGSSSARGARQEAMIIFSAFNRGYDYAEIQHENTNYYHSVGTDHYLSKAVDEYAAKTSQEMAQMVYNSLF